MLQPTLSIDVSNAEVDTILEMETGKGHTIFILDILLSLWHRQMKSLKQPCIKKRRIIHNSISRDRGKTGALIELSVPLEVAAGITNYEIVREHFLKDLAQDPQHPFFVDHKGTPLKL